MSNHCLFLVYSIQTDFMCAHALNTLSMCSFSTLCMQFKSGTHAQTSTAPNVVFPDVSLGFSSAPRPWPPRAAPTNTKHRHREREREGDIKTHTGILSVSHSQQLSEPVWYDSQWSGNIWNILKL